MLQYAGQFSSVPARITKKENLHLTLVFIGDVDNEELVMLVEALPKIGSRHQPFVFHFNDIAYGPGEKNPRMIWMKGAIEPALSALREDIQKVVSSLDLRFFRPEMRPFNQHMTLARINGREWRTRSDKPKVDLSVNIEVPVNSIELMESELAKNGPQYTLLLKISLEKSDIEYINKHY